MRHTRIALAALAVWLTAPPVCPSGAQEKATDPEKSSLWMKKKLEFSQNILAGLTAGDFDKISTNARSMNFLGYLEQYSREDQPDYKRQVGFFEFANKELMRQARAKN